MYSANATQNGAKHEISRVGKAEAYRSDPESTTLLGGWYGFCAIMIRRSQPACFRLCRDRQHYFRFRLMSQSISEWMLRPILVML